MHIAVLYTMNAVQHDNNFSQVESIYNWDLSNPISLASRQYFSIEAMLFTEKGQWFIPTFEVKIWR